MSYIGNYPVNGDSNNSFKTLDSIASYTYTFDATASLTGAVSLSNDTITQINHRFITGQRVTYSNGGGVSIGGLTSGSAYYIIKNDQNTFKLATSYANALASVVIDLFAYGSGTSHSFNVAFDGINTKFKATYDNGTKAQITRAAQLQISINGVLQQPQDTTTPTNGFGIDLDSVIVFSVAPVVSDVFWGNLIANNFPTFDISDNTVDSFTGDNSTINFTLSKRPANNQNLLVTLDGVVQYPSDASVTRAYSVSENILTFVSAPGSAVAIQVRHIGFAGATSSSVTGFYGRTGNVGLTTADNVVIGTATIGVGAAGTSLLVQGNARITGILTIGTSSITLDGTNNTISGVSSFIGNSNISGIITASGFSGNLTGNINSSGVSTFTNGPVFIGAATSTGTASQPLQVTGGAYVSGNLGIGTTNPQFKTHIVGDINLSSTPFYQNSNLITSSYTVPINTNAATYGPVGINTGVVVGITSGSYWKVL